MTITLKSLRARFPAYHVNKTAIGGDIHFGLKGVPTRNNDYACITIRNTEYHCCVCLWMYTTKGGRPMQLAEIATYKSWHALKKQFVRNGAQSKDISKEYLQKQMDVVLEDSTLDMLDLLEAHMADVLFKQQWQHGYLVLKNLSVFGYDAGTINRRHLEEYGNDTDASQSAQETEAVETCVSTEPGRESIVAALTSGLKKVVLTHQTPVDLARCILESVRVYEASYDRIGSDAEAKRIETANNERRAEYAAQGKEVPLSQLEWGFYEKFQLLTIREAVEAVVPKSLVEPVYLLVKYTWNESLDWANEIAKKRGA